MPVEAMCPDSTIQLYAAGAMGLGLGVFITIVASAAFRSRLIREARLLAIRILGGKP